MATRSREPPWERPDPAPKPKKLSDDEKSAARERARRAGRPYPNLVDNMAVTAKSKRTRGKRPARRRGGAGKTESEKRA